MTSVGRTSAMRREISVGGDDPYGGGGTIGDRLLEVDVASTMSAANKDIEIKEATSKVQ